MTPLVLRVVAHGGLCLSLLGCREFGAGGCSHEYRDPLVVLRAAQDSVNARAIARVGVSDIAIGNRVVPITYLMQSLPISRVTLSNDTLWCDVPCGFGNEEGVWRFVASATGYRSQTMQVDAQYRHFDGGCPSYSEGSVILTVRLAPNAG